MSKQSYHFDSNTFTTRELTVTGILDGDPFAAQYFSVPADPNLSLERAQQLARDLFGPHATVTETVTRRKSTVCPSS